jgi:hypothetical protein
MVVGRAFAWIDLDGGDSAFGNPGSSDRDGFPRGREAQQFCWDWDPQDAVGEGYGIAHSLGACIQRDGVNQTDNEAADDVPRQRRSPLPLTFDAMADAKVISQFRP